MLLTPLNVKQPSSTINLTPETEYSNNNETIARLEDKIDKLTNAINKCYDVITLLFNNIMSSNNISSSNLRNTYDNVSVVSVVSDASVVTSANTQSSKNAQVASADVAHITHIIS